MKKELFKKLFKEVGEIVFSHSGDFFEFIKKRMGKK